MPRHLDSRDRADDLALAMAALIEQQGLAPPATRAIARGVRISVGTLAHQFETRERLVGVLCHRTGRLFLEAQAASVRSRGFAGLLPAPDDPDLGLLLRARLALDELGRTSEPGVAPADRVADEERALLAGLRRGEPYSRRVTGHEEVAAVALLCGLRTAMFRATDPLSAHVAVAALRRELARPPE